MHMLLSAQVDHARPSLARVLRGAGVSRVAAAACVSAAVLAMMVAGCTPARSASTAARALPHTRALGPEGLAAPADAARVGASDGGAGPVGGFAPVRVVDTRALFHRPDIFDVPTSRQRAVREILPPHAKRERPAPEEQTALVAPAPLLEDERVLPLALFPGPLQTEWRPPDPNLAVGPSHIVATVNMALTIHDKATGELQFAMPLNNYGTPGLFEGQGAEWFVFDPKCVYDHLSQRFVVVALETYAEPFGTWVNIAVSDDSDPHGIWYTYRTNAAIASQPSAWWDYPSLGYDSRSWIVTGNLIGGSGAGVRVFDKAGMLAGGAAQFTTLAAGAFTTQAASHFGATDAAYIAAASGAQILLFAVRYPGMGGGVPTISTSSIGVPAFGAAGDIPTPNDTLGNLSGNWLMNAMWRDGMLYTTQAGSAGAAWYQIATNGWPSSGSSPSLVQAGVVNPNPSGAGTLGAAFPAIAVNGAGDVGLVMNVAGPTMNPSVAVAARRATDPAGTFGPPRVVKTGTSPEGGRWGDYSGIAIDPVDDLTFWGISEYKDVDPANPAPGNAQWKNWIMSFAAVSPSEPFATVDDAGILASGSVRVIDVLGNDFVPVGQTATIASFDATSVLGGTISAQPNGPGGRVQLRYVAPTVSLAGTDRFVEDAFTYRLRTNTGVEAVGGVRASVADASRFFYSGSLRSSTTAGWAIRYYALAQPTTFPDFGLLSSYAEASVSTIAFGSTTGSVLGSGRSEDVGFVAEAWCNVPAAQLYRFTLGASEGARLYVGGQLVIDNSGPNSSILDRIGFVGLRAGWHPVRVEYYERYERAGLNLSASPGVTFVRAQGCDSVDFNRDGSIYDPADVDAYLSVFAEGPCLPAGATCNDIDFNNDGSSFDPCDVDAFLLAFSEGPCTVCGQ